MRILSELLGSLRVNCLRSPLPLSLSGTSRQSLRLSIGLKSTRGAQDQYKSSNRLLNCACFAKLVPSQVAELSTNSCRKRQGQPAAVAFFGADGRGGIHGRRRWVGRRKEELGCGPGVPARVVCRWAGCPGRRGSPYYHSDSQSIKGYAYVTKGQKNIGEALEYS